MGASRRGRELIARAVSTWTGLQAIAEEQGRTVSPSWVRALIRKEGVRLLPLDEPRRDLTTLQWRFLPNHVLPPLALNAAIGFLLFTVYTTSSSLFSTLLPRTKTSETLLIPFLSGSLAGASQSLVSAPLDNARLLLLRRQRLLRTYGRSSIHIRRGPTTPFINWWRLLRDAVFQGSSRVNAVSGVPEDRMIRAREWARRGWSLWGLSVGKDAVAFGLFFTVFELGRDIARNVGLAWDGRSAREEEERAEDGREDVERRRSKGSLVLQSSLILLAGGMAGWTFGLVSRPFERTRGAIWEGRARWAVTRARGEVVEVDEVRKQRGRRTKRKRIRGVGRAFAIRRTRVASEKADKKKISTKKYLETLKTHQPVALLPRQPMPSSLSLVHAATKQHGFATFFLAPRPVLDRQSRTTLPTTPKQVLPRKVGPTRLSARSTVVEAAIAGGTAWRKGARVLAFVPPYALGFFVYALMSGDLK